MIDTLISVILPIYKEPLEWVKDSVNSILTQDESNFELIVILDCPDNIPVNEWIKSIGKSDSRIKLYENSCNKGLIYNLNYMISIAKGKYIARMDADDISFENRLSEQRKFLEDKNLDIVGCNMLCIDEFGDEIKPMSKQLEMVTKNNPEIFFKSPAYHPTWFAKKNILKDLKYRQVKHAEDYDLLLRALMKGMKIGNVQGYLLKYRVNRSSISNKNSYYQMLMKEKIINLYMENRLNTCIPSSENNSRLIISIHKLAHILFLKFSKRKKILFPLIVPICILSGLYRAHFKRYILMKL
ncbi:glycosyltransferase family 2 protein [Vibrio anguillarum]|uniref:glycosyltransferase family 2 protein n=1 Tax=Vibrio anguillarum TaxID=55601 RepID=UPI0002D5425C|nr:glycosyltransferase [Vibrio anguillarum]OEE42266.1 glycosyl transferase family 2 [Vibrio anguillarum]OEF90724.1 glycosyl transferase family 2 [Vibrio anguillarum]